MDTYEGNSEDPLSLHKYLYAEGDPVDLSDLSGLLAMVPSSLGDGNKIHDIIAAKFALARPKAIPYNSSLRTILGKITPYQGIGRLRPDLVDQNVNEIYDVKSAAELPEGIAKVAFYVSILNTVDLSSSAGAWHPGTTFSAKPNTFPIDATGLKIAVVGPPVAGVLPYVIYQLNSPNELVMVPSPAQIPELNSLPRQNTVQAYYAEVAIGVAVATTATYYLARIAATYMEADEEEGAMEAAF